MEFQSLITKFIPAKNGEHGPVLVLVHGRTGHLRVLEWWSKRLDIPHLAFLMVQAPYPDPELRKDQAPGFSWYAKDRSGLAHSRQILGSLVDEMESQGIRSDQIYFLGFSQGAVMSLDIALRVPKKFGGFICVSGFCMEHTSYPKSLSSLAKCQRILVTHGTRDEIISLKQAEETLQPLTEAGVPFEFKVYDKPHSFKLNEEVPYIEQRLKEWTSE